MAMVGTGGGALTSASVTVGASVGACSPTGSASVTVGISGALCSTTGAAAVAVAAIPAIPLGATGCCKASRMVCVGVGVGVGTSKRMTSVVGVAVTVGVTFPITAAVMMPTGVIE